MQPIKNEFVAFFEILVCNAFCCNSIIIFFDEYKSLLLFNLILLRTINNGNIQ